MLEGLHRLCVDIEHEGRPTIHKGGFAVRHDPKISGHPFEMSKLFNFTPGHVAHGVDVVIVVSALRIRSCKKQNVHSAMYESCFAVGGPNRRFAGYVRLEYFVSS